MSDKSNEIIYDISAPVAELNKVPNFDPRRFLKKRLSSLTKREIFDMDLKYKNLWLRLKYPQSKVKMTPLRITDKIAIVEAQVFFDMKDSEFVSNYTATTNVETDGADYVKTAQYIACDEALTAAGFGCQFSDIRGGFIPKVVPITEEGVDGIVLEETNIPEVPVEAPKTTLNSDDIEKTQPETPSEEIEITEETTDENQAVCVEESSDDETTEETSNDIVSDEIKEDKPQEAEQITVVEENAVVAEVLSIVGDGPETIQETPAQVDENDIVISNFTKEMPVDEILKVMTLDEAKAVVADYGICKGKTLEQISQERMPTLKFYSTTYAGDNNLMRAGAILILNNTDAKAAA